MPRGRWATGFTLIEIAVVIVVLSLLLAMMAGIATAMLGQQRREATRQRFAGVETAIALYVSQNKRLPCPADGRMTSDDASAGLERPVGGGACQVVTGTAHSQTHGVVPWRTLGLSEADVTDGWGSRLTYRVAPELVTANAMDFTACDPGAPAIVMAPPRLTSCNSPCPSAPPASWPTGCTNPRDVTFTVGIKVRNLVSATLLMDPEPLGGPPPPASTGAAYIVISHGESVIGGYANQGVLQSGKVAMGTLEANNAANSVAVFASGASTAVGSPVFVDDFPVYTEDANHFDDVVLRPSILSVASKAQLGARAH
jgi:prepilin-type N-terminal cleavage/methylation domain-containing protein